MSRFYMNDLHSHFCTYFIFFFLFHFCLLCSRLQIYALWVDPKNYADVTRRWYAENISFPLNFFLPGRIQSQQLERLRLMLGNSTLEAGEEAEEEVHRHGIMGWKGRVWGWDFESGNVYCSNLKPRCPYLQLGIDPGPSLFPRLI